MMHRVALFSLVVPLAACVLSTDNLGDPNAQGGSDGSSSDGTTGGTAGMTGAQEGTTAAPTTSDPSTTTASPTTASTDEESSSGCGIDCVDLPAIECDVWAQDCADGYKCAAHADEGESSWHQTRCVPIARDPHDVGDACQVFDYGTSGSDDCDIARMCFAADPKTLIGTCYSLCYGSPDNPMCDEGFTCVIANEGVITLCLPTCDPIAQDCPAGQACYPFDDGYACAPAADQPGDYGDDCTQHECAPGFTCVAAESHPACETAGCCTPWCDPEAPLCPEGTVCTPDDVMPDVGRCLAP
ncbi:MAG TPA: hypothetical protein VG755_36805 [Nannocystaceae bacterium]|nr:hypothetical protein [Nannocystaceae bacterium]